MFNKDFLIWCKELQFKEEHMELPSLPDIINEKEDTKSKKCKITKNENAAYNF